MCHRITPTPLCVAPSRRQSPLGGDQQTCGLSTFDASAEIRKQTDARWRLHYCDSLNHSTRFCPRDATWKTSATPGLKITSHINSAHRARSGDPSQCQPAQLPSSRCDRCCSTRLSTVHAAPSPYPTNRLFTPICREKKGEHLYPEMHTRQPADSGGGAGRSLVERGNKGGHKQI